MCHILWGRLWSDGRWLCDVFLCSFLVWADVLVILLFHPPTHIEAFLVVGRCIVVLVISSAHHSLKLELYGQMYWHFFHFIRPPLIEAWIVWADVLVFLTSHPPATKLNHKKTAAQPLFLFTSSIYLPHQELHLAPRRFFAVGVGMNPFHYPSRLWCQAPRLECRCHLFSLSR